MTMAVSFSCKRLLGLVVVLVLGLTLVGCAGPSKQKEQPAEEAVVEQKGSLSRVLNIVDEQGRKSGTLTLDPLGGAVLRDENGTVIGRFKSENAPEAQPAATPSEPEPSEATSEPEPYKEPSEPEPAEDTPELEATTDVEATETETKE